MKKITPAKERGKRQAASNQADNTPNTQPAREWNFTGNLINNIWDAWIVTDLEFNILEWNKAAEKMYGWTKEEVVNRQLTEFIKTEYLTEINTETALQELTESGHWQGEVIQNRKDGSLFTILASVSMARDAEGRPVSFIAINRDLTERKLAEENLLQFRQIMDETNDAIFLIDAETCKYVDFNKSARTMLGYSSEELSQLGPMDVAREIASFSQWLEWVKVIREKGGWLYETIYQRRDKTNFPVEVSSKLISPAGKVIVAMIVRDITERRYAEETLQKSEELYRLLAENSSDAVSLINADGKVLYVSPSYNKILGFPSEDYFDIELPEIMERIHPEDRERILLEIMRGNELKLASSIYSYRAKTKQGGYVWVEDVLRREFDENGLLIRTIVNGRDITERKRMEEALIQSKNQAQKNNILLQSIMESPQGIVIFALDVNFCYIAFTVTHKNTMKTIWGVDIEIGMNMLNAITDPLDREKAKKNFERVLDGEQMLLVEEYGDPQKYRTYYEDRYSPIRNEDGVISGLTVFVTDITERRQFEEELSRQNSQLESVHQISIGLTAELNLEKLLESITTHASELLKSSGGGIYLYRDDQDKLELAVAIGTQKPIAGNFLERGEGLSGKVWELGKPLAVDDYETWEGRAAVYNSVSFKAVVGAPILRGEEFLGVLTLMAEPPKKFSQHDVALLELYAVHAAVAIHNARLYQNLQSRMNQLEMLYETSKTLSGQYDLNVLLQSIVDSARKLLRSSTSGMYLVSNNALRLTKVTEAGYPVGAYLRFGEGMAGRVAQTRLPIRVDDYSKWEGHASIYNGIPIHAVIEVPMLYKGELIGVLTADESGSSKRKFTEEDEHLMTLFASQAAGAIHSARLYSETRRRAQEFAGLYETTLDLSLQLDLSTVLTKIIERAKKLLDALCSSISLYDSTQDNLELVASIGPDLPPGTRRQLGDGLAGRVAESRSPIIIDDYSKWEFRSTLYEKIPYGSMLGVPLLYSGHLLGVLDVAEIKPSSRVFNEADMRLLSLFAGQAASAIENAKLFDSLQNSHEELSLAYDATIEGWSRAMDLRDKETEGHTQRLVKRTLEIAERMGISQQELIHVRRGVLLHDMGKLGVPDHILLKPGALSADEWKIMRQHPTHAYEMLSFVEYLKPALDIPYCHHEKWDGSGYPRGLKEENIPLVARLFAVVDVWDALRSDRPYRPAWSVEQTREYIIEQSGRQFDPHVVEVFLKMLDESHDPR